MKKKEMKETSVDNLEELDKKSKGKKSSKENKEQLEINELKEQVNSLNDKYLRILAEFENYKKRTLKEKEELLKYGTSKVLSSFLSIFDDIERAIETNEKIEDKQTIIEGINLIHKKFQTTLKQNGVEEISSVGSNFSTDFHEALSIIDANEEQKDKVIHEVEKGYTLNGKVLRFAKVVVGK